MQDCTRTVGKDDADRLPDIVAELREGAVLCLEPGTYPAPLRITASITIRGAGAPGDVVVDARRSGALASVASAAAEVVIERLTLTGGEGGLEPAGIGMYSPGRLLVRDVVFRGNHALGESQGAAIATGRGEVVLERCRVLDCEGTLFYVEGARLSLHRTLIARSRGERALLWVMGDASVLVDHVTAADNGAAALLDVDDGVASAATVAIRNSIVAGKILDQPLGRSTVVAARTLFSGDRAGVTDGGGNRTGEPLFARAGDESYRPRKGSPAAGLAEPGAGVDLAGRPAGGTSGALEE